MDILIFISSVFLFSVLGAVSYVVLLLLFFKLTMKGFKMNEAKWDMLFKYKQGKGFYYIVAIPYFLMLLLLFPSSLLWFRMIHYDHELLGAILTTTFLALSGLFKFLKISKSYKSDAV